MSQIMPELHLERLLAMQAQQTSWVRDQQTRVNAQRFGQFVGSRCVGQLGPAALASWWPGLRTGPQRHGRLTVSTVMQIRWVG